MITTVKPFIQITLAALTFVATVCVSVPAQSFEGDKDAPTTVEADKMTYDDLKQVNVFTGNVLLIKGSLVIRGDKLTMRQSPEGYQFGTAEGKPATFRQKRDGKGELFIDGEGDRIDYDGKSDTVVLQKKAQLRKLNGTVITDEVKGDVITYLQKTEFFTVTSDNLGTNTGRVKAVIQPKPTESDSTTNAKPMKDTPQLKSTGQLTPDTQRNVPRQEK
jgi:lipopolysaccharide export system protein LptA